MALVVFVVMGLPAAVAAEDTSKGKPMVVAEKDIRAVAEWLKKKHGPSHQERIDAGVRQVAGLWTQKDGTIEEYTTFCKTHFLAGKDLDALFDRFQRKLDAIDGGFNAMSLVLQLEIDEDLGEVMPVDRLFAGFSPAAHMSEDMFMSKLSFVALLNFPVYDLKQMLAKGDDWTNRKWAEARLAQRFSRRIPAEIIQKIGQLQAKISDYIYGYNIFLDKVIDSDGKPMFRKDLRLISHWGLRDEIKAQYAAKDLGGLTKQQTIYAIMLHIINQQIPAAVINNPKVTWDPHANLVDGKQSEREDDVRYRYLQEVFKAEKMLDPYYPGMTSVIDRRFNLEREIPEKDFVDLLKAVLSSPVAKQVAELIEKRLARKLQPFDIWYDGFKSRGSYGEQRLDKIVGKKYPNVAAFERDLPNILRKLGFSPAKAVFLAKHIEVDASRGPGHAWGPGMPNQKAHLRTRFSKQKMDYKGYNIAIHELGHNVEQVLSMNRVEHTLMAGVPNTAFTEGFAFVFQARDLDLLGLRKPDAAQAAKKALDVYWQTFEIAGVSLLDIQVWHWLYAHPEATTSEIRDAVVAMAKDIWNRYYAPVFGVKDSPILAIYSHMIAYSLYLPDYALGHMVAYQIEDYFKKRLPGKDMERMCSQGDINPDLWMKRAVGEAISVKPLIEAAGRALRAKL